jgi:hypothetical protein
MKSRWIILFTFSLIGNVLFAQDYTFKVLASKGKTEVKSADTWQALKVGASLSATDEIKIAENAYLGLMHAKGKPLELKQAGNFKVSDLIQRAQSGSSVLMKYTDFILSSNQEKKNRLTATGAVHRGVKDLITVFLPGKEKADLYGDKVSIQWITTEVAGPYEVIITDFMDEKLARFETNETSLVVSLNEGKLKDAANILVKVASKKKPNKASADYAIKKLQGADREKFATMINEFKSTLEPGSALSEYILAGFYEENLLLNDALTAYKEATRLSPDVDLYKEAYSEFLTRLGFKVK